MYCRNCGNKLNDGDQICNNCNTPVINNNVAQNNPNPAQKTGKNPATQFIKHELILIGITIAWFVIITIIIVFINVVVSSGADDTLRHHPSAMYNLIMKGIMPFIQIIIPALVIMFGWIPILIHDLIKNG